MELIRLRPPPRTTGALAAARGAAAAAATAPHSAPPQPLCCPAQQPSGLWRRPRARPPAGLMPWGQRRQRARGRRAAARRLGPRSQARRGLPLLTRRRLQLRHSRGRQQHRLRRAPGTRPHRARPQTAGAPGRRPAGLRRVRARGRRQTLPWRPRRSALQAPSAPSRPPPRPPWPPPRLQPRAPRHPTRSTRPPPGPSRLQTPPPAPARRPRTRLLVHLGLCWGASVLHGRRAGSPAAAPRARPRGAPVGRRARAARVGPARPGRGAPAGRPRQWRSCRRTRNCWGRSPGMASAGSGSPTRCCWTVGLLRCCRGRLRRKGARFSTHPCTPARRIQAEGADAVIRPGGAHCGPAA